MGKSFEKEDMYVAIHYKELDSTVRIPRSWLHELKIEESKKLRNLIEMIEKLRPKQNKNWLIIRPSIVKQESFFESLKQLLSQKTIEEIMEDISKMNYDEAQKYFKLHN